jgi:hypothetical protein
MKSNRSKKSKPAAGPGKPRLSRPYGALAFPEARGKTLDGLYLTTGDEANCITLTFNDRTEMVFDIDPQPRLAVLAEYSDWTTGNQRVLRRWPPRRR